MTFGGAAKASDESSVPRTARSRDLRSQAEKGTIGLMTATLTLDEAGRLVLPEAALRVLGIAPGTAVQAEVTADRIEILPDDGEDLPVITELEVTPEGRLVLPKTGVKMDTVAAIKADREARIRKLSRR